LVPTEPQPGEVWFAELGRVEKSRPALSAQQYGAVKAALRELLKL
jgi:hypothetical protein